MILLLGILFGLVGGLVWAVHRRCTYTLPAVRGFWVVLVAFVLQSLVFSIPRVRAMVPAPVAAIALVSSQLLLVGFVWLNRKQPAFWLLGGGLLLNLIVILANGGLMPISPQTIQRLAPETPLDAWTIGTRFGTTKDIILAPEQTRLEWFADRFTTPTWFPQRVAFSLGDVLIACGAFWLFWHGGNCQEGRIIEDSVNDRVDKDDSQGDRA